MPDGVDAYFQVYRSTSTIMNDGDTITIKGYCEKGNLRIGFGECNQSTSDAEQIHNCEVFDGLRGR